MIEGRASDLDVFDDLTNATRRPLLNIGSAIGVASFGPACRSNFARPHRRSRS
jgi:hypothetical protein